MITPAKEMYMKHEYAAKRGNANKRDQIGRKMVRCHLPVYLSSAPVPLMHSGGNPCC